MTVKTMRIVITVFVVLTFVAFVFAQSRAPITFTGTVEDPSGARTAGAEVTLDAGTPNQMSAKTDATGTFKIENVAPGAHQVQVQQEGFRLFTSRVTLPLKSAAPLRVVLTIADVRVVTVNESAEQVSMEASDNKDANSLDAQTLNNIPVFDQDYISTLSMFLDDGSSGTAGTSIVVDGMEATDAGVSASAIKEVKINNDPYSAEFQRPGRGRIEVVTKAPDPVYHGTFNFIFRDSALNARNAFATTRPDEQRRIFDGFLSGPIANSKTTSFLISANRNEEDSQAIINAENVTGPITGNVPNPLRNTQLSARIDHYFKEDSNMSVRYTFQDRSQQNQGVGGFTLASAGTDNQFREHRIILTSREVVTPKLLNQFQLLLGMYDNRTESVTADAPKVVVLDAFTGGGAQGNFLRTERHFAGYETVSYASGRHVIKAGINIPDFSRRGFNDFTNTLGTYTYAAINDAQGNLLMSALEAYENNRPSQFVQQIGDGHLHFNEKVIAGFIQDEIKVRPNLTVTPGLRYDWQNYFHDNNNFAPRMSFAYSPGSGGKTIIRGGSGVFYDRTGPGPIADLLHYDGLRLMREITQYDANGLASVQAPGIVTLAPKIRIPYSVQYSAGVERQLGAATTLTVTYIGSRGIDLFRSRDINAPFGPLYAARPDAEYSQIRQIEAEGRQVYNALEVQVRGRVTRFFNGQAQYRLSSNRNNTSGIGWFPSNQYDPSAEWGPADWDARHRLNMLGTIDPGKYCKFGIIVRAGSGHPYTETIGSDVNGDGFFSDRPAGVGRNTLWGASYVNVDLRWFRDFYVTGKREKGPTATVSLDAFNVLNHTNYSGYIGDMSSSYFGQPTQAWSARRLQTGVKFMF